MEEERGGERCGARFGDEAGLHAGLICNPGYIGILQESVNAEGGNYAKLSLSIVFDSNEARDEYRRRYH